MQKTVRLSCFLLLWGPCLLWHRQDIRMANLGCLCWGYWGFFSAQPIPINLDWWHLKNHIAVCSIDVWQQGTHLLMLMKQGSISLPESKDHIKPYPQPDHPSSSMWDVLSTRRVPYGAKQPCINPKYKVQLTEDGHERSGCGKWCGPHYPPLHKSVSRWPNVTVKRSAGSRSL